MKALAVARELGLKTAAFTGGLSIPAHGVVQYCDLLLNVPNRDQKDADHDNIGDACDQTAAAGISSVNMTRVYQLLLRK